MGLRALFWQLCHWHWRWLVGEVGIPLGVQAGNSVKSSRSILSIQACASYSVPPLFICLLCSWTDATEA